MENKYYNLSINGVYSALRDFLLWEEPKLEVIVKLVCTVPTWILFDVTITWDKEGSKYSNITITSHNRHDDIFKRYLERIVKYFVEDSDTDYKFKQKVFYDGTSYPNVGSLYDDTYSWHLWQDNDEIELFIMRKPCKQFIEKLL